MSDGSHSSGGTDRPKVPKWRGRKAVLAHVTYSQTGDQYEEGDEIGVLFHDRGLVCTVEEIVTEEQSGDPDSDQEGGDD
jgi:hypothetical protein